MEVRLTNSGSDPGEKPDSAPVKTYRFSYLLALNTCGTRQQSARLTASPTHREPAVSDRTF